MFQVANLMQSGTLEVFFRPPTSFPARHQVYDLHNDGNSVLQFGQVPHHSVSRRQMELPTRYYGLYPAHFCCHPCVEIHVEKRGNEAKFLWPYALPVANQQESLAGPHLSFAY